MTNSPYLFPTEDNCHPDAVGHVINGVIECFCKPGFYGSGENCTGMLQKQMCKFFIS
jgi:hypothetical protein